MLVDKKRRLFSSTYHTKMNIELKRDIYVRGEDGQLHQAHLRIREKKCKSYFAKVYRYLYLVYRDGDKVKEYYIAKLESGVKNV